MADIYDQHKASFASTSAYVILKDGEKVATVAIKFPKDGAGRLYAYVHWVGIEMVRGSASGYGYDKRSAAVASACQAAIKAHKSDEPREATSNDFARASFFRLLSEDGGEHWDGKLMRAGFAVLQAV